MEPIWIVSGSNELRCGVVEADAVELEQRRCRGGNEFAEHVVDACHVGVEGCIHRAGFRITTLVVKVTGSEPLPGPIAAASVTNPRW